MKRYKESSNKDNKDFEELKNFLKDVKQVKNVSINIKNLPLFEAHSMKLVVNKRRIDLYENAISIHIDDSFFEEWIDNSNQIGVKLNNSVYVVFYV